MVIDGDDWFIYNGTGFSGEGTPDKPYVTELKVVSRYDDYGYDRNITTAFDIRNTNVHMEIGRCSTNFINCSVRLTNVTNCSIAGLYSRGYLAPHQIILDNCSSCQIADCGIDGANCIQLYSCREVTIVGNSLYGSSSNLELWNCERVHVYHNDFLRFYEIFVSDIGGTDNTWDNGYPSGGNFWQGVNFEDHRSGSNQNGLGGDGIGDTPYIGNVTDRYPLIRPYSERSRYETREEASQRFPEAILGNIVLVPTFVLLLPRFKLNRGWTVASLVFAAIAAALCWPTLIDSALSQTPSVGPSLPILEIAIFGCMSAAMALFVKARDWIVSLRLPESLFIGIIGAAIVVFVSIQSGVWVDLPWMSSGTVFIAHTLVLVVGASALGWYVSAGRRLATMNILKDSVELDCRILLLIFVVTAFGLAASVFGYGLLTPQYVDVVNEGSRSVLLNALPGSAAIAAIMASIRSLRAVPKQRLSIAITIAFLLMLAFIYLAINEYLAWRYGT